MSDKGIFGFEQLWSSKWVLPSNARFVTFGSCFAQHISRALVARDLNWFNAEPAPGRTPSDLERKYNYGVFSARTGNIYTAAQFRKWVDLACGDELVENIELWTDDDGRVHDLLRPRIEPNAFSCDDEARYSLRSTAQSFKRCIRDTDVFVLTLGLTEGWINTDMDQVYTLCPGTGTGTFDTDCHAFKNYTFQEIHDDLSAAFDKMWALNPDLKILLTVSPVPLVATASGDHVLVATQYSKSVLRAVAGQFSKTSEAVDYFPSYEIIASPPSRATFFQPDMRSIASQGVDLVMSHFFAGLDLSGSKSSKTSTPLPDVAALDQQDAEDELVCEELILESQNQS